MKFTISDTFNSELPADPVEGNQRRQVQEACFSYVTPRKPTDPTLIHASSDLAKSLNLSPEDVASKDFLETFSGAKVLPGTEPYAMCYGGHQFGNWAGQLGDGRAINLTEIIANDQRWALQLKGAGETPYSRTADGLAVLRSSIREHLCSEAMYHLGVPSTRSLSLMLTGDNVMRDVMYNGNPAYEKGAVVCRVAESFLRFGNFQIFAARKDYVNLEKLVDYTIKHFYTDIKAKGKERITDFFSQVAARSLDMVIHWQRVGFVHGVMNTDNMSILGLTIDYGPYGWLEGFDPDWTPNTTDKDMKRYRFGQQPNVVLWNLMQLANALYPLVEDAKPFEAILADFRIQYQNGYLAMMRSKLGLSGENQTDVNLIGQLEQVLQLTETDMTIFYRELANFDAEAMFESADFIKLIEPAFYKPEEVQGEILESWQKWFLAYGERLQREEITASERKERMNMVNPKYVLRNYMAQLAIDAADLGDNSKVAALYDLLRKPYSEQPENEQWYAKRPEWARHKVGCSMLSCSS